MPVSERCSSQRSHHVGAKTVNVAFSEEGDERDLSGGSRLETDCRSGGNVQPHAARLVAIEGKRWVCFEKMIMDSHLNGTVPMIGHRQGQALRALVERDFTLKRQHLPGFVSCRCSTDRMMHGDEFRTVRKGCLDLDVMDHLRDAFHHLV